MKPTKYIITNMKMNLSTEAELNHWLTSFIAAKRSVKLKQTVIVLCPQAPYVERFVQKMQTGYIDYGVQNCFWEEKGAYTGEISPVAARTVGAKYVILGHSERRQYLGETDEMIALKLAAALKARLRPILCVGENAKQKANDQLMDVVLGQLRSCLQYVPKGRIEEVIFCYEPVWAISANKPDHMPSANEIMGAKLLIKKYLVEQYGRNIANRVTMIYGGSVDSKNIAEVCVASQMHGGLVGGASLMPYELIKLAQLFDAAE